MQMSPKSFRGKILLLIIILFAVYSFICYLLFEVWISKTNSGLKEPISLKNVIVHFDFKGAPPKLSYLKSLLPMLKFLGVTGLLMEYEDMFPYEGKLVNISAVNCYRRKELQNFLRTASRSGFEIIPLIQTFGHMEHVLKLREFKHLREVPLFPDSLCPSKAESKALVTHMVEQIIEFHSSIFELKHIHIGCDEVFHINKCQQCLNRQTNNRQIFEEHIMFVAETVNKISKDTKVLIWDDMLSFIDLHNSILSNIEPVIWHYGPNNYKSHLKLYTLHNKFNHIWIASAFKGADGRDSTLPNIKNRLANHLSWMQFISNYTFAGEKNIYEFKGLILTGWSRYSHMDPICDLLPGSIPSLVLNLLVVQKLKDDKLAQIIHKGKIADEFISDNFAKVFNCNDFNCDFLNLNVSSCDFVESNMLSDLRSYDFIVKDIENEEANFKSVDFSSKIKNLNMNNVLKCVFWLRNTIFELDNLEKRVINEMTVFYNNDTVKEFVYYKFVDLKSKLRNILNVLMNYTYISEWERKPYNLGLT